MALDWRKAAKPVTQFAEFKPASATTKKTAKQVLAANIDKQIALARNPKAEGRRWYRTIGDKSAWTLRFANKPLVLGQDDDGKDVLERVWPTADLPNLYEAVKADVLKGDFDDQLADLEKMIATRVEKMAVTRAAGGAKGKRKGK